MNQHIPLDAFHGPDSPTPKCISVISLGADKLVSERFHEFQPISLEQTNKTARMLSRIDNKYVVNFIRFQDFLKTVKQDFAVLEINGLRQFSYNSCYFDDNYICYHDHHQGRRLRFKVRTREYMESGDIYFEVKLKGLRGLTSKHRTSSNCLVPACIDGDRLEMLRNVYREQYRKEMSHDLQPALMVGYKRCTLVALGGNERVTIDYQLTFSAPDRKGEPITIGNDFMIIETKSIDGKGIADKAMKKLKIRKASKCSKYCIGVNMIGGVTKNNYFRPTLKQVMANVVTSHEPERLDGENRYKYVLHGPRSDK